MKENINVDITTDDNNLKMHIKTDAKVFEPKGVYTITVEGPYAPLSKSTITYDNDNFESELDLVFNTIKTVIMASKQMIDSVNNG